MTDIKKELMKAHLQSYHEGIIDTINNIRKALYKTYEATGKYPSIIEFTTQLLPRLEDIENKIYAEKMNYEFDEEQDQ